ncbi:MAG: hypothetical protein LBE27_02190, partial [Deltaproteobacteria bacterium]|nr:hypothetical protein [Deltaproteobacteria bacterium]
MDRVRESFLARIKKKNAELSAEIGIAEDDPFSKGVTNFYIRNYIRNYIEGYIESFIEGFIEGFIK